MATETVKEATKALVASSNSNSILDGSFAVVKIVESLDGISPTEIPKSKPWLVSSLDLRVVTARDVEKFTKAFYTSLFSDLLLSDIVCYYDYLSGGIVISYLVSERASKQASKQACEAP